MATPYRNSRGGVFGGGAVTTDQRTTAQLNRIAKALHLAGHKEAGEIVALAALSVHIAATVKSRRRRRLRKSYQQAVAASDPAISGAIVVPFPSRRRSARRSS